MTYIMAYVKNIVSCIMILPVKDVLSIHALTGPSPCKIISMLISSPKQLFICFNIR